MNLVKAGKNSKANIMKKNKKKRSGCTKSAPILFADMSNYEFLITDIISTFH